MVRLPVGVCAPLGAAFLGNGEATKTADKLVEVCLHRRDSPGFLRTCGWMRRSERPQPALGEAVRQLRRKSGATQETVAREAGITIATLSQIERGEGNPTWDTVTAIASALDVSMGELGKLAEKLKQ